ncbi:Calycin-like protein [Xylariales sp. PMI_506]|nr:Calycin-like protein [Xylariales sp. PMI_506]
MLFKSWSLFALVGYTAAGPAPHMPRQSAQVNVTSALYDESCYYPTPDPNFPDDLTEYLGVWYQVAGTPAIFTLGCTCITATYGLNDDGTVSVYNTCQLGALENNINGTATPVDAAYGSKGTFQVSFPNIPGGGVLCPGPNYIVQKYDPNWAIVQSPDWSTLFLLSREQNPSDADIDAWLDIAGQLGTNLSLVSKVSQDNCNAY